MVRRVRGHPQCSSISEEEAELAITKAQDQLIAAMELTRSQLKSSSEEMLKNDILIFEARRIIDETGEAVPQMAERSGGKAEHELCKVLAKDEAMERALEKMIASDKPVEILKLDVQQREDVIKEAQEDAERAKDLRSHRTTMHTK